MFFPSFMDNMCENNDKTGQSFRPVNCFHFECTAEQQKWSEKNYVVILRQHLCRCELLLLPLLLPLRPLLPLHACPTKVIYDKLYINRMRVLNKFPLDYKASLVHNMDNANASYTRNACRADRTHSVQKNCSFFFVCPTLRVLNSIRDILLDRLCKRLNFMKISTCTEIKRNSIDKFKTNIDRTVLE